ncbi:hypothetical protein SAMN05192576_1465 [Nocardioides szechwanensis]|uniref:Uncharacterized protein n=1 Tax=Nocardioides szechwanensis TaxID=1005944 RepID=A0A1G9YR71_9ACTN|nr:hypothetical protein SAMN05192576_1465 [Nocardioides szechwanensis]
MFSADTIGYGFLGAAVVAATGISVGLKAMRSSS